jgi:uncharacterized repeat protein (TIGR02543 family)
VLTVQGEDTEEKVVLELNFAESTELPADWNEIHGNWKVSDGKLHQNWQGYPVNSYDFMPALLTFDNDLGYLDNFRFEATLQFDDDDTVQDWSFMGLSFDVTNPNLPEFIGPLTFVGIYYKITAGADVYFAYYSGDSSFLSQFKFTDVPESSSGSGLIHLTIEVYGKYASIYFNDIPLMEKTEIQRYEDGIFGFIMGFGGVGSYYDVKITELPYNPCAISTGKLLDGVVGLPYLQKIVTDGDKITRWNIDGNLPTGLSLSDDGDGGVVSGIPIVAGVFPFTVTIEGAKGDSDSKLLSITIDAAYLSSFLGNGVDFSSGDIELVSADKLSATPKTFEAWVKMPIGADKLGVIVGNGATDGFGLHIINFGVDADGKPWLYWKDGAGNEANYTAYANVAFGEWVHVAIVYDSESNKIICYVNGDKADEQFFASKDTIPVRPLKVGGDYMPNNPWYFPGEIADIRIWSSIRTQTQILENMNAFLNGDEFGLMANWLLDEQIEDCYTDNSVQGNDLRLWHDWLDDIEFYEGDYTIVVIPDIQYMTLSYPDILSDMFDWIVANVEVRNIQLVIQVGDLTDRNTEAEWERVADNLEKLDGVVPYVFIPGNHDYAGLAGGRDTTLYNKYLLYSKYSQTTIFCGAFEENKMDNVYYYFSTNDADYMLMCLEFLPRNSVLEWANGIIAGNSFHRVIVVTHSYLSFDKTYDNSGGDAPSDNIGVDIWNKLVYPNANVIMVLCGHIHYDDLVMRIDTNIAGHEVPQLLVDAQEMDYYLEGIGMLALLTFNNYGHDVSVNWYSTKMKMFFRDWNQFLFSVAWDKLVVLYDENGGVMTSAQLTWEYNQGETVTVISANPRRAGFSFAGWFYNNKVYFAGDSFMMPNTNVVLVAQWLDISTYVVTFNYTYGDGGVTRVVETDVEEGSTVWAPVEPKRLGYTFLGWFKADAEKAFDFSTPITDDVTLIARWELKVYTVSYNLNEGTNIAGNPLSYTVDKTPLNISNPNRTGYVFVGWTATYVSNSPLDITKPTLSYTIPKDATGDVTLFANWRILEFTVQFVDWDGVLLKSENVTYGASTTAPQSPSRTNYIFTRWDNSFTTVTANMTITAQYIISNNSSDDPSPNNPEPSETIPVETPAGTDNCSPSPAVDVDENSSSWSILKIVIVTSAVIVVVGVAVLFLLKKPKI